MHLGWGGLRLAPGREWGREAHAGCGAGSAPVGLFTSGPLGEDGGSTPALLEAAPWTKVGSSPPCRAAFAPTTPGPQMQRPDVPANRNIVVTSRSHGNASIDAVGAGRMLYPSMNPNAMGARPDVK